MKINEQNLTELGKLLDPTGIIKTTREELLAAFKKIVEMVQKMKEDNARQLDKIISTFGSLEDKLNSDTSKTLNKTEKIVAAELESLLRRFSAEQKKIDDKMATIKDGEPADEIQIVQDVLTQIKLPEYKEVILDDAEKLRDKLETLKGNERLDKSAIKGLEEELARITKKGFGGVISGTHLVQLKSETPIGATNGTNTSFTVVHKPDWITINGQSIYENYGYALTSVAGVLTLTIENAPQINSVLRSHYTI